MREKWVVFLLAMGFALSTKALDLKVRIYSNERIKLAHVTPDTGTYYMVAYNSNLSVIDTIYNVFEASENRELSFRVGIKHINVKQGDESLGAYFALQLKGTDPRREFRIKVNGKSRVYHGDIQMRILEGYIQMVNIIDLEHYVAGVVESEGGHVDQPEFFKAQAVLARTFALKNLKKHADDGYNLKDDVTSQVYFSKARHKFAPIIIEAVKATKDTVIVTAACEPILGVFHANSGGITTNAEDAWLTSVDYLRAKPDSFSIGVGSYAWERKISKDRFYDYAARKMKVANTASFRKALLNFDQQNGRKAYFTFSNRKLKLTHIRHHFKLRSTYFTIDEVDGYIVLKGKGYGHGVGLSQDGAIEMSKRGYSYRNILKFYFDCVDLESVDRLNLP
jgi:stage II sporulation protein D